MNNKELINKIIKDIDEHIEVAMEHLPQNFLDNPDIKEVNICLCSIGLLNTCLKRFINEETNK